MTEDEEDGEFEVNIDTTIGELLNRDGGGQRGTVDSATWHFFGEDGHEASIAVVRGAKASKVTDALFAAVLGVPLPPQRVLH